MHEARRDQDASQRKPCSHLPYFCKMLCLGWCESCGYLQERKVRGSTSPDSSAHASDDPTNAKSGTYHSMLTREGGKEVGGSTR